MHPILIKLGPLTLYTYGLFLLIAFVAGLWLAEKRGGSLKKYIPNLTITIFISGIVGARIFCILSDIPYYTKYPNQLLSRSGFIFHGGVIFVIIFAFLYCRKNSLSFLKMADIFSPSLALGIAIGRIGCFFEGCCFGKPTSLFLGIVFPKESWAWNKFGDIPIHPVQIYSFIANLFLFFVLLKIKPKGEGDLFFTFLLLYSIFRFFIEFLRDQPIFLFSLTQPQIIFAIIGIISIIWFFYGKNKQSV